MITVVTFLWRPHGKRAPYGVAHVNAVLAQLDAHAGVPFEMVCVTDDPVGLDRRIRPVPIDSALTGNRRYAKLMLFRPDAMTLFGGWRLLMVDLDVVMVGDLRPLLERQENFVIWRDAQAGQPGCEQSHRYNSSLILMDAGCWPCVWTEFDPAVTPAQVKAGLLIGSDQAWIGTVLGRSRSTFTQADGVLSFKRDLGQGRDWPDHARMIFTEGLPKAWDLPAEHSLRRAYERRGARRIAA